MKWESADLTVGAAIVGATVLLVGTLLWLSPAVSRGTYPLWTEFTQIGGIAEQAPVVLGGYNVGRVASIEPRLADDGALVFRVRMNLQAQLSSGDSLLLPVGTRARLVPPPVLGSGFIALEPPAYGSDSGRYDVASLEPGATIPGVRDVAVIDRMQTVTDSLTHELALTLGAARNLMGNLDRTALVAHDLVTGSASAVPAVLREVRNELVVAQQLTQEMRDHMATLVPATTATIDSTQRLLSDTRLLLGRVDRTFATHEPELASILANLDTTALLLEHVSREFAERPLRVLRGFSTPEGLMPASEVAQ